MISLTSCLFQTYFLPVIGLVDAEKLKPGDLVVRYEYVNYDIYESLVNPNPMNMLTMISMSG